MEETTVASQEREWEQQQLKDIEDAFNALRTLQKVFLSTSTNSKSDLSKAAGRRCILGVSGLKYHEYRKFFEVTPTGVEIVQPYDTFNTYILAPVDSVLRVLRGTLEGDTEAFAAEWARGKARLSGERRLHDGYVFSAVFKSLALLIKRYREVKI